MQAVFSYRILVPGWILLALSCFAQTAPAGSQTPLATVAGQPIYETDLLPLIQAQMRQLHNQEYEIKSRALENLINQKLLEAEAKKNNVAADKLLEHESDAKVVEPTDAEIEAYYLGQKDRLNRPLEEIRTQLRQALKQTRIQQARQDYLKRLREEAHVAILLKPLKVEIGFDPARVRGNPRAPVTIVEFSDFQCPYCQRVQTTLKELLSKYDGRVRLAFRDFPLHQLHPNAQKAAEAARCAGEQGKFWEYHDLLFANQGKLDAAGLSAQASTAGLDTKQFDTCLANGKFKSQVEQDLQEGTTAGVSGTPGFYINGVFLSGSQPAAAFEKIIDAELLAADPKRADRKRADR